MKSSDNTHLKKLADLAGLTIDENEEAVLNAQLQDVIQYFQLLDNPEIESDVNLDIDNVSAGQFREDTPKPSLPVDVALMNTRAVKENFFTVPQVIDRKSSSRTL